MDIGYLYNIIDLYLKNEKDHYKTNLSILKRDDELVFSFNMNEDNLEKTSFSLSLEDAFEEINNILKTYKQDMMIIKEEYSSKNNSHYHIVLQNGRGLSLDGFSPLEINNFRNVLYNITINSTEIRLNDLNKEKKMAYNPNYRLAQAGFTSYTTLFLVALYLTDVFLVSLVVFKVMTR